MKKLIVIAFFAITSIASSAQTHLDSLVFNKINEYRVSINLFKLIMSPDAYNIAKIVSDALAKTESDRFNEYTSPLSDIFANSTVAYVVDTLFDVQKIRDNDSAYLVKDMVQHNRIETLNLSDEKLAESIINFWTNPWSFKNGTGLNWITEATIKYASVSVTSGNKYLQYSLDDGLIYDRLDEWNANIKFISFTCYK